MKKILLILIVLILVLYKDNACDKNFIPYGIRSFDVWVYNDDTDKEYYAGNVTTDYLNAQTKLNDAQLLAYDFAEAHHLKNWNYLCCTVTNSSNCVTKIR